MKKTLITIAAIGFMIVAIGLAVRDMKTGEVDPMPGQKNGGNVKTYLTIVAETAELKNELGDDTPYCDIYKNYNIFVKTMGMRKSEALKNAESTWLQNRAITWYAKEQDLLADSESLAAYMEDIYDSLVGTEEYPFYEEIAKKKGITVEELIQNDWKSYRTACDVNNVYESEKTKYKDEGEKPFTDYWKEFVGKLTEDYKKTEDYAEIKVKLENSVKLVQEEKELTPEELEKEDIFVEA